MSLLKEGYEAAKKAVDVTDFSSFAARFAEAVKEHGTPDVLFYNVGITAPDDKEKLDAKTLVEHYIADVAGAYQQSSLSAPRILERRQGQSSSPAAVWHCNLILIICPCPWTRRHFGRWCRRLPRH